MTQPIIPYIVTQVAVREVARMAFLFLAKSHAYIYLSKDIHCAQVWSTHGHTAAELIVERADTKKQHMGLTTWTDAPTGKIQKFDVVVAKNYLAAFEMGQLEQLANVYLDIAETQAQRKIPMTMEDWETRLNSFIKATGWDVSRDAGNGAIQRDRVIRVI